MPEPDLLSRLLLGDVILTSNSSPGSSPIRVANFCKGGYEKRIWSHAALYIGNGQIVESVPGGVRIVSLYETYLKDGKHGIRVLRKRGLSSDMAGRIITFCTAQKDVQYDHRAIAYFVFLNLLPPYLAFILTPGYVGGWLNRPNAYFCSELVSEGFKRADVYCFEHEPFQVMPVDFSNSLLLDEVLTQPLQGSRPHGKLKRVLIHAGYLLGLFIALIALAVFLLALCLALVVGIWWIAKVITETRAKNETTTGTEGNVSRDSGDQISNLER